MPEEAWDEVEDVTQPLPSPFSWEKSFEWADNADVKQTLDQAALFSMLPTMDSRDVSNMVSVANGMGAPAAPPAAAAAADIRVGLFTTPKVAAVGGARKPVRKGTKECANNKTVLDALFTTAEIEMPLADFKVYQAEHPMAPDVLAKLKKSRRRFLNRGYSANARLRQAAVVAAESRDLANARTTLVALEEIAARTTARAIALHQEAAFLDSVLPAVVIPVVLAPPQPQEDTSDEEMNAAQWLSGLGWTGLD